jgi:alpha-glycerophosphate oxidase/glycerol-3-phosphate dehydrogenase
MPMGQKTCIGTTDTRVDDPATAVTDEDRDFVLANANELLELQHPLTRADIIAERCGVRPLAVSGSSGGGDWISMSRKHAIDVNTEQASLSIFGGKITDCVNVGDEVCDLIEKLGIRMPAAQSLWYGEPDASERRRFHRAAQDMNLEQYGRPDNYEGLADRLWRRYGLDAFNMLESIRKDRNSAERVIKDADYMRCEIEHTANEEMIVKLEDFLRRRSKISLVVRRENLLSAPGLKRACDVFFGDRAEAAFSEYFAENPDPNRQAS